MPLIAGLFSALLSPLFSWFVTFFTRKIAVLGVTLASFAFLVAAFLVCIKYLIATVLALAIMPAWISAAIGMFMPFNFAVILSSIMSAQSCRWAYDKAMDKIKLINSAV